MHRSVNGRHLLQEILDDDTTGFALLMRPDRRSAPTIEVLIGPVRQYEKLEELPLESAASPVLAAIPFRQIRERGLDCVDDGEPILGLIAERRTRLSLDEFMQRSFGVGSPLRRGRFDISDDDYAALVTRVISDEIGNGEGANFVIKRSYLAQIETDVRLSTLAAFQNLIRSESGSYWTFLAGFGSRTLLGASPELHIRVHNDQVMMNPISGTYRYPTSGPDLQGLTAFLSDKKEADELYMVAEEELKMMASFCRMGAKLRGPYLKEMSRLAHTEYTLAGQSLLDRREILRQSLFAPSVVGSPLPNACRVIARTEPNGRSYYAGVLALFDTDVDGRASLDSSILIRSAEIDPSGTLKVGVGATIVRNSDPVSEVKETTAKAAGVMSAFTFDDQSRTIGQPDTPTVEAFASHPDVRKHLADRNRLLNSFWLGDRPNARRRQSPLRGKQALVVNAEDSFTDMVACKLRALGLDVRIESCILTKIGFGGADLVVAGPGPGDPMSDDSRMVALRKIMTQLLANGTPFLALCLSHQILCSLLGFELVRLDRPNQGRRRTIDLFGQQQSVGFYNTFQAVQRPWTGHVVAGGGSTNGSRHRLELAGDPTSGEIFALRGPRFVSLQFHPESLLTRDGLDILEHELVMATAGRIPPPHPHPTGQQPLEDSRRV